MPDDHPPQRIQRRRTKGWVMPEGSVYVGRPTFWGNPYRIDTRPPHYPTDRLWNAQSAVECFEIMLASGWRLKRPPGFQIVEKAMEELEDKDLVCWCPLDQPCHADILLRYANGVTK